MTDVSGYIDYSLEHTNILLRDHPDAGYEYFWLNFKDSVKNIITSEKEMQILQLDVYSLTCRLNRYKEQEDYDRIGAEIQSFLKRFFWQVLVEDPYHVSIASTNFNRWIRYCKLRMEIPVRNVSPMDPLADPDMFYLYFLHQIKGKTLKEPIHSGMSDREQGLKHILEEAVNTRSTSLFNKLLVHYPDWTRSMVSFKYGISLPKGIKNGSKVIKILSH